MLSMKPPNICVRLPPLTNYVGYQRYKSVCEHLETNKIIKKYGKTISICFIYLQHILDALNIRIKNTDGLTIWFHWG